MYGIHIARVSVTLVYMAHTSIIIHQRRTDRYRLYMCEEFTDVLCTDVTYTDWVFVHAVCGGDVKHYTWEVEVVDTGRE